MSANDLAALLPCDGCGELTDSKCGTDCGMSICGSPLCECCRHVDEKFGWRHEPRANAEVLARRAPSAPDVHPSLQLESSEMPYRIFTDSSRIWLDDDDGGSLFAYVREGVAPSAPVEVAGLVEGDDLLFGLKMVADAMSVDDPRRLARSAVNRIVAMTAASAAKDEEIARLTARADNLARLEESHRNQANEQFHRANREQARAERAEAALAEREQQVADLLDPTVTCACGYDSPNDVCLKHMPVFKRLTAALAESEAKLAAGLAACDVFDGPVSKSKFVNGQATAAQQIRGAIRALNPNGPDYLAAYVKQAVEAETRACAEVARRRVECCQSCACVETHILARLDQPAGEA